MNTIRVVLLESPLLLLCVALAAELVFLWWYNRRMEPRRWTLAIVPAVFAALFVVQWSVVTDQEALRSVTRQLAAGVDEPDLDLFMANIDDDFALGNLDRAALGRRLHGFLVRTNLEAVGVGAFKIEVDGDEASVAFRARARVEREGSGIREYVGRWRIKCVRRPDGWKVVGVEHVGSPGIGAVSAEQLFNY